MTIGQVVTQVQPFVIEVVANQSRHEQQGCIAAPQPPEEQGNRHGKAQKKEQQQNRRKEYHLEIAGAVAGHHVLCEKVMVLHGVALEDFSKPFLFMMHGPLVTYVLDEIGIEKSEGQHQPFHPTYILQQPKTNDNHGQAP